MNGRAELVTPKGSVFAREGDVLDKLVGSFGDAGEFLVCFASQDQYEHPAGS